MQFYDSGRFVFLVLIPLIGMLLWLSEFQRKRLLSKFGNPRWLEKRLVPNLSRERRRWAAIFLLLAFLFAILASARPQWGNEKKKLQRQGVDIIFLLDTSLSMLAEDLKPNRLEKSKLMIKNMLHRLGGDRVGMVAFAGSSFLQSPLTLDYSAFLLFVDALDPGFLPVPGTSLGRALPLAARAFPEESKKYRAIIIFSDGEDHEGGIDQSLEEVKKAEVRVYAVGAGTPEGEPIPLRSSDKGKGISGYKKDQEGQVIVTRLNEQVLGRIAQETGGLYLRATGGEKELDLILKHLETLGKRQLKERLIAEREDHFQLFLLLAFLSLAAAGLLGSRKGEKVTSVLPLLAFLFFTGFMSSPRELVEKGNDLVKEKRYQTAVESYRQAEIKRPKEPVIRYNLGTALYRLYQYQEAGQELEQSIATAKEPETKARALYNYGNTQYRLGNFEKAIDSYKKVLEINPEDVDAKYNLEFLQKKKSQFEQKQNQKQDQKDQNEQQQKNQQNQQNQKNQQNQPEQGEDQKQEGGGGAEDPQDQQEKSSNQQQGRQQGEGGEENQEPQNSPQDQNQRDTGQEGAEQDFSQDQQTQQGDTRPEEQEGTQEGKRQFQPLQGQMGQENALRILDALKEGEKQLQDLRRPPAQPRDQKVDKDW